MSTEQPSSFLQSWKGPSSMIATVYASPIILMALIVYTWARSRRVYENIPVIGNSGFFLSYFNAVRFLVHGDQMLREGYTKNKSGMFRVPEFGRWHIVVCGEHLVQDLYKATDDTLSFSEGLDETLQTKYTLGSSISTNHYHVSLIRRQLSHNLDNLFPELLAEIVHSFKEHIPPTDDWTSIKLFETLLPILAQSSNRVFVGAPLCRDPAYIALNIKFTGDVFMGAQVIKLFPSLLKPLVAKLFTNVPRVIRACLEHLKPLIEERQARIDEYGIDYPDKPCDFLSWLMDEAKGEERSTEHLTLRVLTLNFQAIHTSTMSITHALFHLASKPEYIEPLREEVESIVGEDGWTKVAIERMHKLDSFLKETQRVSGFVGLAMQRKAVKGFTFSDGTYVPPGTLLSAAATARHHDPDIYSEPDKFDGFRFSNMEDKHGQSMKFQFSTTSKDFLLFGHGRHACPGRFFAANELKTLMAHILVTYDIKMKDDGIRPADEWIGPACLPNRKAEVLFRGRQACGNPEKAFS